MSRCAQHMLSRLRSYPMIVLLLPLVVAILIYNAWSERHTEAPQRCRYTFVIDSNPKPTPKCERYKARVLPRGEVFLYLLRDSTRTMPIYGDTVHASTTIERKGRYASAFAAHWTVCPRDSMLKAPLQRRLYQRLSDAGLQGDELATTGAMTLGYKEDLDTELRKHFQASGAAHVLAVSGLHTGIIYGLLLWLMTLGGRFKPRYENRAGRWAISMVIIATMWGYAWLTGMTPSVVRAVLMVTIFEIGRMFYRQAFSLNTIAAAAVLILLVRPDDLWSVSFQLSFAATTAIVLMAKNLTPTLPSKEGRWMRIVRYILGILIVSLAAQIGTLPLTMFYFGQISNYFLLTNLIVLPLATLLVPCGLLTIAFGGTGLGLIVGKITYGLAWAMNHAVEWIEHLLGSTTKISISGGMVAAYYAICIGFCILYAIICTRQKKLLTLQSQ